MTKMENNEGMPAGAVKRRDGAGIALIALSAYSALSFVLLLIIGKLIPTPLAEYMAFAYTYGMGGKIALCVLFTVLYLAAALLCTALGFKKNRSKPFFLIPAAVLVFADLAVHVFAFLASTGYQWIYLICAVLDGIMLFCMLYRSKDRSKG